MFVNSKECPRKMTTKGKSFVLKVKALKVRNIKFPKLPTIKIPILRLRGVGLSKFKIEGSTLKISLWAVFIAIMTIGIAIFFAVWGTGNPPIFPDPGLYATEPFVVGDEIEGTQTLKLLISGARINNIILDGVQVGKLEGLSTSINITAGSDNVSLHYIECENIIIDGLVTTGFNLKDSEIYNLVIRDNFADGNSFSPTISADPVDISFGSTRGALNIPEVSGSDFDQIIINAETSNATCGTLELKNVQTFGAPVALSNLKAGTLIIENSIIGDGSGINSASFVIESTTKVSVSNFTNNEERPISVR